MGHESQYKLGAPVPRGLPSGCSQLRTGLSEAQPGGIHLQAAHLDLWCFLAVGLKASGSPCWQETRGFPQFYATWTTPWGSSRLLALLEPVCWGFPELEALPAGSYRTEAQAEAGGVRAQAPFGAPLPGGLALSTLLPADTAAVCVPWEARWRLSTRGFPRGLVTRTPLPTEY